MNPSAHPVMATLLTASFLLCPAVCQKAPAQDRGCNGSERLCQRRFNEVAYPSAHNAMSALEEGWSPANHYYGMPRQLAEGIRAMMLDTHYEQEVPHLCHGWCGLGKKPLTRGLEEIKAFLACRQAHGRLPNFLNVDFYSIGDLFEVVHHLNNL